MVLVIINNMCVCETEVETTEHFHLPYYFYISQRLKLLKILRKFDPNFVCLSSKNQIYMSLYGCQTNDSKSRNYEIP